jgi:hypothetical protein
VAYESSPLCVYDPQSPTTCKLSDADPSTTPSKAQYLHGVLCVVPLVRSPSGELTYSPSAFSDNAKFLCNYSDVEPGLDTPLDGIDKTVPPHKYGKVRSARSRRPTPA